MSRSTLRSTLPASSRTPMSRAASRTVVGGLAGAAALLLATALPASAHVHADPSTTAEGGYSVVTFRVPNESETAATTTIAVQLPTDHPFTYVATRPVPGWTAQVAQGALPAPVEVAGATVTQAPLSIVWTADAGTPGIAVGQFQEFEVNVGPLPQAGTRVLLPTVQTYSDGEVSSWTEVADEGAAEPENPAPEFDTTAAAADEHADHDTAATTAEDTTADDTTATTADGSGDGLARGLGGAGLVLGAAALVVSLLRRSRS